LETLGEDLLSVMDSDYLREGDGAYNIVAALIVDAKRERTALSALAFLDRSALDFSNYEAGENSTILCAAIHLKNVDLVTALLDRGINPDEISLVSEYPLVIAAGISLPMWHLLYSRCRSHSTKLLKHAAIHAASELQNEILEAILRMTAPFEDIIDNKTLLLAVVNSLVKDDDNKIVLIEWLLECGLNVNQPIKGRTALKLSKASPRVNRCLVDHGAHE
jgi:hypothetical protein